MMEIVKPKEIVTVVSRYFTKSVLSIYNPPLKMMHIFILTNISALRLFQYNSIYETHKMAFFLQFHKYLLCMQDEMGKLQ